MGSSAVIPPPPPGFVPIEQAGSIPPPPPGFVPVGQNSAPQSQYSIGGSPQPQGIQESIVNYLRQLEGDVKYGTGQTFAGKLLKVMGAQGTEVGAQSNLQSRPFYADQKTAKPEPSNLAPASMLTGPIHALQGVASGDVGDTLSGIGEAATIPSLMTGAPASSSVLNAIPDAKAAGEVIGQVERAHGLLPVNPQLPERAAQEAKRLRQIAGYQLPSPITAFLRRLDEPNVLNVEDARKAYSSAISRLSPDEAAKIKPAMRRQLAIFADKLGDAINEALAPTGKADEFMSAINEYHRGKQMEAAAKFLGKSAAVGTAGYAGYSAAKGLVDSVTRGR